ncbi:MAG: ATP-dependent DNA helicase [Magnetococcales bacterium]|nr:ATP-dependent DNA helicase [Magnetococcales bacterium]MBF0629659.1 ATP-dependent DNA helicase [Magnetococcales bacterium]
MLDPQTGMKQLFGPDSLLAKKIDGYELRPAQEEMATLVFQAVAMKKPLLVEAATGTGKTLAYLLPLLHMGKRVIVSTATKALQDQIIHKDLSLVRQVISRPFKMAIIKGRANYLCQFRYQQIKQSPFSLPAEQQIGLSHIDRWLKTTQTGDKDELDDFSHLNTLWHHLHADTLICPGRNCPDAKECFLAAARHKAMEAHLVIANHYLFFADLALKDGGFGEILPKVDVFVFDEAHRIPDIVTRFFGWEITNGQIQELIRDSNEHMEIAGIMDEEFRAGIEDLQQAMTELRNAFPEESSRGGLSPEHMKDRPGRAMVTMEAALYRLLDGMEPLLSQVEGLGTCKRRAAELLEISGRIRSLQDPGRVHWYETRGRFLSLTASPLETGPTLRDLLFPAADSHIFTSATLATGTDATGFTFFARQLGLESEEILTKRLPPPFDYAGRTLLYVPLEIPEPTQTHFPGAAVDEIVQLLDCSKGRALLLFTSQRMLEIVHEGIRKQIRFPLLVQGTRPNGLLLRRFVEEIDSVLLGLASFWEGVDVPGESLSMVVVDRLPFASPGDPLMAAKSRWMESQAINPFKELYIPKAILSLKQGLGRLLRRREDRGVLAVLDRRMVDKWYGRRFIEGLPPSPLTRNREAVRRFFS